MTNDDRQGGSDVSTRLTYLLIGGGIGAIIALLFAPKPGSELRGDIADVTRKGIDKSREAASFVGDKAGDYYGAVRDKATDLVGGARNVASQKRGQFSAAIEAGRQAYTEEKRKTELSGASEAKPTYPPQGDLS
jgi:gas vesicle protein